MRARNRATLRPIRVVAQKAPPRLAYRVTEAAKALGMSLDASSKHVAPQRRWVRRGAIKMSAKLSRARGADSAEPQTETRTSAEAEPVGSAGAPAASGGQPLGLTGRRPVQRSLGRGAR